ncbi:type II toxin-antitoxin system death-on-curing family toxin [Verrucomicrobiaceae bacterium R5-34]|nr:type II toxin-antitoxin system death-on-curing family toxin [Verrucomicrobiaceae bacterium R5-34]
MIKHLTLESVLAIHDAVLSAHGGMPGLREESLLESAIAAPQATFGGEPIMSDIIEIGAAYLYYLCKNHPFLDGNKRTALASCLVVLSENGQLPSMELDIDDWEQLVLDVASSSINRQTTTVRLQSLLT